MTCLYLRDSYKEELFKHKEVKLRLASLMDFMEGSINRLCKHSYDHVVCCATDTSTGMRNSQLRIASDWMCKAAFFYRAVFRLKFPSKSVRSN